MSCRCLSIMRSFSVTSANIAINDISYCTAAQPAPYRSATACTELRGAGCDTVKPAHSITAIATVVTVQQRHVLKAALITCKVVTTATPSCLNDLITVHIPAGPTCRSSTRPLLTVPHLASDFARRSFCFFSPTVWNSLPCDAVI